MTIRLLVPLLAFTLAACGDGAGVAPRAADGDGDGDRVVLRVSDERPPLAPAHRAPLPGWTLYADGRVVTGGAQIDIYPPPAMPALRVRTVSEETVERITRAAREAGLDGRPGDYGDQPAGAAGTTVFVLDDGTGRVEARVPGLQADPDSTEDRRRLSDLVRRLVDLEGWLGNDAVLDESEYRPRAMAAYATAYRSDEHSPEQEPRTWPGPDPAGGEPTSAGQCLLLSGADLERALPHLEGSNTLTPWTAGGTTWLVKLRPLLPDERGCADAAYSQ